MWKYFALGKSRAGLPVIRKKALRLVEKEARALLYLLYHCSSLQIGNCILKTPKPGEWSTAGRALVLHSTNSDLIPRILYDSRINP